jgi:hypothetical protein
MAQYRVNFARIGQNFNVAPLVIEADGRDDLAMAIGDFVNHLRTELIGGDLDDNMLGGRLTGENGANYGTFTVIEL